MRWRAPLAQEDAYRAALDHPDRNGGHQLPYVFRIDGAVDTHRLGQVVDVLVGRHDALSQEFHYADDQLWLAPGERPQLEVIDCPADSSLLSFASSRHAALPDDKPAWFLLVRDLRADQAVFIITLDHRLADAHSGAVILGEISKLYAEPALSLPPVRQFADWAAAQRAALARDESLRSWWRGELPGFADRYRRSALGLNGKSEIEVALAPPLSADVAAAAASFRTTPFCVLLAAMSMELLRLVADSHVLMTTNFSHRNHPHFRRTVGCLTSRTIVAIDAAEIRGHRSPQSIVSYVSTQLWRALDHSAGPFSWVQDCAGLIDEGCQRGWPYLAMQPEPPPAWYSATAGSPNLSLTPSRRRRKLMSSG